MEKAAKIFKLMSFQYPPFSPSRDKRSVHAGKGFSGPIVSIIPDEARRKGKSDAESQEPTSPKVSCIGQIKQMKKVHRAAAGSVPDKSAAAVWSPRAVKKHAAAFRRILGGAVRSGDRDGGDVPDGAPSPGQMRRFASGRDALANFDWTMDIAPVGSHGHRNSCSGDEVVIPFSAPVAVGGGEGVSVRRRKEVNLWKRRTMAPPGPLATVFPP